MDISSIHMPYVIASYALAIVVFIVLSIWIARKDYLTRQELTKLIADES